MKKSTGSFLNSYQNKAASQATKFWFPGLCPRSRCTVPSHEYQFTASEIRGSLQGYLGLLTAGLASAGLPTAQLSILHSFLSLAVRPGHSPCRELNAVQCVNDITQHPFAWLLSWPGWSLGCDAEMNKDVLRSPRGQGSGIWRLSLG